MSSFERADLLMGTVISQKVWGERGEEAMAAVYQQMCTVDRLMSAYKEDSDVSKINRLAGIKPVVVDPDTFSVVVLGMEYGFLSEGHFDITIAPLVKAWDIMGANENIPTSEKQFALSQLVDYQNIVLDQENSTVFLPKIGQMIDLGGLAKGWACDRALEIYKFYGVQSAMINLGGNVAVMGTKPDGSPWRVGVQDPKSESGEYLGVLAVNTGSVVTSGGYQRYFERDGLIYHHILDPQTGMPVKTDLLSATIIAPLSSEAEGLSTPVFMAGVEGCRALIKKVKGAEAVLVDLQGHVHITQGAKAFFTLAEGASIVYDIIE